MDGCACALVWELMGDTCFDNINRRINLLVKLLTSHDCCLVVIGLLYGEFIFDAVQTVILYGVKVVASFFQAL